MQKRKGEFRGEYKTPVNAKEIIFRWMPLLVALCVLAEGLYFITATKPGHIPDIWSHVYRVDAVTNGDIIARPVTSKSMLHNTDTGVVGGAVDRAWMEYSLANYDGYDPNIVLPDSIRDKHSPTVDLPFNNAAINNPVAYLPQIAGFAIGKALGLSCGTTYQIAEIMMLIVYVLMMFCAVRALPRWRIPIGLLLCLPPMVSRASFAISADSFTQAVTLLFSCLLIRGFIGKRSIRGTMQLAALGLVLSMVKFTYVPLVLLMIPLIFDSESMPDTKRSAATPVSGNIKQLRISRQRAIPVFSSIALSGVCTMLWLSANSWYTTTPMIVSYAEMSERKHMLLTHPNFLAKAIGDICYAVIHAQSNMNSRAQSLIIAACWFAIIIVLMAMIAATVTTAKRHMHRQVTHFTMKALPLPCSWLIWLICTGIIVLTYLALWLQYTTDDIGVNGVQYRYFLPLAALFGFVLLKSLMRIAAPIARPAAKPSEK